METVCMHSIIVLCTSTSNKLIKDFNLYCHKNTWLQSLKIINIDSYKGSLQSPVYRHVSYNSLLVRTVINSSSSSGHHDKFLPKSSFALLSLHTLCVDFWQPEISLETKCVRFHGTSPHGQVLVAWLKISVSGCPLIHWLG